MQTIFILCTLHVQNFKKKVLISFLNPKYALFVDTALEYSIQWHVMRFFIFCDFVSGRAQCEFMFLQSHLLQFLSYHWGREKLQIFGMAKIIPTCYVRPRFLVWQKLYQLDLIKWLICSLANFGFLFWNLVNVWNGSS